MYLVFIYKEYCNFYILFDCVYNFVFYVKPLHLHLKNFNMGIELRNEKQTKNDR